MSVKFVNKPISETAGQSVLSCAAVGTISAGFPVGIYISTTGVRTARAAIMASTSVNSGIAIDASTATGDIIDVSIGGTTACISAAGGTTGQFITGIGVSGTCTTAAIASANVGLRHVLGIKTATNACILY